jgi:hypothetical protein
MRSSGGFFFEAARLALGAANLNVEKYDGLRTSRCLARNGLSSVVNGATGRPLSKATIAARLAARKAIFQWLSQQSGFKSRISYTNAKYFNPSGRDARIAKGQREKQVPSIRDRALIAFVLLSGACDDAIASMCLRHTDRILLVNTSCHSPMS